MSLQEITCKCGCGRKKMVRTADVKRGWGLFFDKKCKARWQNKSGKGRVVARKNMSKKRRYELLCAAYEDGRVSSEYFYRTLENEYEEFASADDHWEMYMYNDVHPFSCEGLGQWDD